MSKTSTTAKYPLDGEPDEAEPLGGRSLRFVLVGALMARPEMTVAEMVTMLAADGHRLEGRPSKVISDALRWEIRRGRVRRLGRGRYCYVTAPPTTAWRIREFARRSSVAPHGLALEHVTASGLGSV